MTREQAQVADWMRLAGQAVRYKPTILSPDAAALRLDLIREEVDELDLADADDDLVRIADALGDLLYVILGTAVAYGIDLEPVFQEVHRSNMSKLKDCERRPDGKILKGPYYTPPNLMPILEAQSGESPEVRNLREQTYGRFGEKREAQDK